MFSGSFASPPPLSVTPPQLDDADGPRVHSELTARLLPQTAPLRLPSGDAIATPAQSPLLLRRVVRRMGNYLAYFTLIGMLILIPKVLYQALESKKVDLAAYKSAWIMVCGTIILSVRLVYLHFTHWYMPDVQKYVVRIVWMVPLYAMQSYLSLRFHEARIYIDSVRDFYEAYVIASFVYYLMALLGGQDALVYLLANKDPALGRHTFPLSLILQPWVLGEDFALQCKHGVLQYVVIKTFCTVLIFLCESAGIYGEGKFDWFVAYPYLCLLQNVSVMYALYCLVMLYAAVEAELRSPINWRPLGKFLCVKGIVFFCWWQGVVIFYLRAHGIIQGAAGWSSEDVANGLIDYCVVIEMVLFAVAHSYTFTYQEYLPTAVQVPSSSSSSSFHHEGDLAQRTSARTLTATSITAGGSHSDVALEAWGDDPTTMERSNYRPPETLARPMRFRDAFWSSSIPKETIQDIQRLRPRIGNDPQRHHHRHHLDDVHDASSPSCSISLQDMSKSTTVSSSTAANMNTIIVSGGTSSTSISATASNHHGNMSDGSSNIRQSSSHSLE